jgi:hypothetical protein
MATTGVDFVLVSKVSTAVQGAAVKATPFVVAVEKNAAQQYAGRVPGGAGTGVLGATGNVNNGNFLVDGFSTEGFALNGAIHVTTSGTTPVSVDLTNLTTGATSTAGDATFAKFMKIRFYNCGSAAMTIAPGGSNPASLGLGGTSPTLSVPANTVVTPFANGAGVTVDSTHKIITITPTSGGDFVLAVGGA